MAPKRPLTLNEQLMLLDDPTPTDFDPEALENEFSDGGGVEPGGSESGVSSGEDDGDDGQDASDKARQHYLPVGTTALRAAKKKAEGLALLGPKYEGARVSRERLYDSDDEDEEEDEEGDGEDEDEEDEGDYEGEDGGVAIDDMQDGDIRYGGENDEDDEIDSDDALGSSDEERFKGWKFAGSATTEGGVVPKRGDRVAGSSSGEGTDQESSGSDNGSQSGDDDDDDAEAGESEESEEEGDDKEEVEARKALSKIMAEEKRSISESISRAAQSDVEKGAAVRQQQKTFDSFLSTRIKLQKALVAVNTLPPTATESPLPPTAEAQQTWKAAEASVLKLWNTLYSLRVDICAPRTAQLQKKRRASEIDGDTPLDEAWSRMARLEADNARWREGVLEKWSVKTQTVSTVSIGRTLNNAAPRSLTASIRDALATDRERLLARARVPRSCAPVQAAKDNVEQDPEIFDDTDLYQQLLKALVDQRTVDSSAGGALAVQWTAAMRDAKRKKKVDTKASKGRKLRYHVHEKLQNFMAPEPNNRWQDYQATELFSSLLGQRARVDEDDCEDMDEDLVPDDGLRLFR